MNPCGLLATAIRTPLCISLDVTAKGYCVLEEYPANAYIYLPQKYTNQEDADVRSLNLHNVSARLCIPQTVYV